MGFVLAATVTLLGGASWVFLTGPLARVNWPREVEPPKQSLRAQPLAFVRSRV